MMDTMDKKDATKDALYEDNVEGIEQGIEGLTPDLMAPWDPYFLEPPDKSDLDSATYTNLVIEWAKKRKALFRMYGATSIMYPDITPQGINNNFYITMDVLLPILEKDSPRRFLSFFKKYGGWIVWRKMIIPEALNCLITEDAVKCAKVALEGKAPELHGYRANPNWMTQHGHFPLHQAAEIFSIDMIKLLISKGASANVRTAGNEVVEGLLPLHVAVENTCMHKYLEDNLLRNREHPVYSKADVYKLIHLVCLPEMRVFLDVTRELAKHTNDLVDEIWYYIKDGKLVQAGVLLLAAQEYVRSGSPCKKNVNSKQDGFATIANRIANHYSAFGLEMGQNKKELEQPHVDVKYHLSALLLVNAISQAGKALSAYIRVHSEVPHVDVLERVSSILKEFGFCPPEECIDIGNLKPYKCAANSADNPNCVNRHAHFPLHQAAEIFSVDEIKLLISKGASANVRATGETVIQGLLPLHVAVESTCLHKYVEDNLMPNRKHPSYSKADIYKLIHLLCLPQMKIFLDTTRELAKHTNGVVDEVWNYIKDGKLVHAGVLLLAAQEHMRLGYANKKNGNSKPDGFATITNKIIDHFYTFDLGTGQNGEEHEQPHAHINYLSSSLLLVNTISQAGKTLHEYIQVHSKVPHMDVLERVSSILKGFGFCPTEEGIDIENIYPNKCTAYRMLPGKYGHIFATKKATKTPFLHAARGKAETKKAMPRRWKLGYQMELFFPYWRSVLSSRCPVKFFPAHAAEDALSMTVEQLKGIKSPEEKSTTVLNDHFPLLGAIQQQVNHQPRRSFSSAATLLKVLRQVPGK
ncbi:hypothetical protein ACP4OV_009180 [Aristida adscensionis]